MLVHDPVIEREGGRKLREVLGWHDPTVLARQYIDDVEDASHGFVRYQIAERVDVDGYPVKQDGFAYTDDSYLRCWRSRSGFHQPDGVDYLRLLNSAGFIPKLEAGQVDELWLFGFPYAGYYESMMGGRGAIWCNAPPLTGAQHVARRFVIMGFNYERDAGCMLENLGHRAESILEHVFARAPVTAAASGSAADSPARPSLLSRLFGRGGGSGASSALNLWQQFTLHDRVAPGRAACGNVHFAPNSERDYDWGNRRTVPSTCDDWLHYPNLGGLTRAVNCAEWGNGDMRLHHLWWFKRFPHVDGYANNGIPHNWWKLFIDPNQFD